MVADRVCEDTAHGARSFSYGRNGFPKKQIAFPAGPAARSGQPSMLWCCSLVDVSWQGWSILCSQGGRKDVLVVADAGLALAHGTRHALSQGLFLSSAQSQSRISIAQRGSG